MKTFQAYLEESHEEGVVQEIIHSIIHVAGLPGASLGEIIIFEGEEVGQVMALRREFVEVLMLSRGDLQVGGRATRTGFPLQIETSAGRLGQVLNSLGVIVEGKPVSTGEEMRPVDMVPAGIAMRHKINRSLETGIMLVDLMLPLGLGQRELILGDRKTGKSYLARLTALHQAKNGNLVVYALIGKKKSEIKQTVEFFRQSEVMQNLVIVVSSSHDSVGEIYLTPFTAMTIAEYFKDQGRDVLVILDDMTTHAKFYRELSLLARKFPGRDSYPGDIFHLHSKLVERAGNFKFGGQETAITCLPLADVVGSDLTGYIQTNLMSMTDGHVLFDGALYAAGRRPAINPFLSVTRVGHQTQNQLRRDVNQRLLDLFNDYERTQSFLRFGAELGENSRQILTTGDHVIKFFDQPEGQSVPINLALAMLALLWSGVWNGDNPEKFIAAYHGNESVRNNFDTVVQKPATLQELIDAVRGQSEALLTPLK